MIDDKNAPYNEQDIEIDLIMTVTVKASASVIIKDFVDREDKLEQLTDLARKEFKSLIENAEFEIINEVKL